MRLALTTMLIALATQQSHGQAKPSVKDNISKARVNLQAVARTVRLDSTTTRYLREICDEALKSSVSEFFYCVCKAEVILPKIPDDVQDDESIRAWVNRFACAGGYEPLPEYCKQRYLYVRPTDEFERSNYECPPTK